MDRLELARNASAVVFLGTLVSVPAESVEASDCILDRTAPVDCYGGSLEGCQSNCQALATQHCWSACPNECNTNFTNNISVSCQYEEGQDWVGTFECICFAGS